MQTYEGYVQVQGFVYCYGEASSVEEFKQQAEKSLQIKDMGNVDVALGSLVILGWEDEPEISELQ